MEIRISTELLDRCPQIKLDYFIVPVKVGPSNEELLEKINEKCMEIQNSIPLNNISMLLPIAETRDLYRTLGKKPGRYRSSAEALLRRVVTSKGLYRINNVVDLINLVSISTYYSIGGYDADQIAGPITLSVGQEGELYEAIARGALNIANLPVLRDEIGAFGSPTSDSVRTSITNKTKRLLFVFYNFGGKHELNEKIEQIKAMFHNFCRL